jgi:hypothetical protein
MHTTQPNDATLRPALNWLDKTLWAMAKLAVGETRYNVYVMKVMIAGSLFVSILMIYRLCWKVAGIVDIALPTEWWALALLYGLCYVPIYLATHSAVEIENADLPSRARWAYTALGLFIFPVSWGLFGWLLVWLESGMG